MVRLTIDGQMQNGRYRVECECGQTWNGEAEGVPNAGWSPALPIAECIAHVQLGHAGDQVDLRFSRRFDKWLLAYWEQAGNRLGSRAREEIRARAESKR